MVHLLLRLVQVHAPQVSIMLKGELQLFPELGMQISCELLEVL